MPSLAIGQCATSSSLLKFVCILSLSIGTNISSYSTCGWNSAYRARLMPRHLHVRNVTIAAKRAYLPERPTSIWQATIRHNTRPARQRSRPSTTPTPSSTKQTPSSTFQRSRALPWVLSSLLVGCIAFYGATLVVAARKPCINPASTDPVHQKDVSRRYDDTADNFDSEVGLSEFLMGINRLRKKLAQQCTGHVLEVSCGTGRNLGYYDISNGSPVQSLTLVDLSPQMVEVCKKKWNALFGTTDKKSGSQTYKPGLVIRFLSASALDAMPLSPADKKYDTIVQTMGLCSTPSPKELLLNMTRHLDTTNPDARILLLEHGRSYRSWLNNILDGAAEKHAEIHGCWFNRDIGALVEEAARQSGLQVVNERRHHFGTTWVFELRPSAELVQRSTVKEEQEEEPPPPLPKPNWRTWLGLG